MKKLLFLTLIFFAIFTLSSPKIAKAREQCSMLPGNIQCFRSWCGGAQIKVCNSNQYCLCYDSGETIQEGPCAGEEASPLTEGNCSVVGGQEGSPLGGGNCGADELDTAIGCIPLNDSTSLVGFILRWAIGIGGGIAFILILVAGFQIMTSQGDPQRLQAGKELLTSAIAGILLIIFSVFILEVIGVDVLGIPGFNQ